MATVTSVTNHFITAQEGFSTTLSSSISSSATTVPLNSVAGYADGEVVAFVVDPADAAKKQVFTGTIDSGGSQVTSVVWTEGTNQAHSAGASVVDYTSATHQAALVKGLAVAHNQDGTLKDDAVTTDVIADDAVDEDKIGAGAVTNAMLNTGTGELGAALQSWTPTLSGRFTDGDWTKTCKYTQIGKRVYFTLGLVSTDATPMAGGSGSATFTLPVTSVALVNAGLQIGEVRLRDATGNVVNGKIIHASTTTAFIVYDAVSGSTVIEGGISSSAPFTWATNDGILGSGWYEVA